MPHWISITAFFPTTLIFHYYLPLKGLSHEMDLAFGDIWLVLGLNRGRGQFLNFLADQMIL